MVGDADAAARAVLAVVVSDHRGDAARQEVEAQQRQRGVRSLLQRPVSQRAHRRRARNQPPDLRGSVTTRQALPGARVMVGPDDVECSWERIIYRP